MNSYDNPDGPPSSWRWVIFVLLSVLLSFILFSAAQRILDFYLPFPCNAIAVAALSGLIFYILYLFTRRS
jgi:hypothetical protein